MSYLSFYVTFPDKDTASIIIHQVVSERLAACGNSFSINSCYFWNENIENSKEVAAIIKTSECKGIKLLNRIEELHPYEIPCISYWKCKANETYESWIAEVTKD